MISYRRDLDIVILRGAMHALRAPSPTKLKSSTLDKMKWNEMNRALGHLCAHIG